VAKDELQTFSRMTKAAKDVAQAIRENKTTDMHAELYKAIMSVVHFSQEALTAALGRLVDNKAQGTNFFGMEESHGTMWPSIYLPSTRTICSGSLGPCGG
jgi:hypothetical protein